MRSWMSRNCGHSFKTTQREEQQQTSSSFKYFLPYSSAMDDDWIVLSNLVDAGGGGDIAAGGGLRGGSSSTVIREIVNDAKKNYFPYAWSSHPLLFSWFPAVKTGGSTPLSPNSSSVIAPPPKPNPKLSGALLSASLNQNTCLASHLISKGAVFVSEDLAKLFENTKWETQGKLLAQVAEAIPEELTGTDLSKAVANATKEGQVEVLRILADKGATLDRKGAAAAFKSTNLDTQPEVLAEVAKTIPTQAGTTLSEAVVNAAKSGQIEALKLLSSKGALLDDAGLAEVFQSRRWNESVMQYVVKLIPQNSGAMLNKPLQICPPYWKPEEGVLIESLCKWTPLTVAVVHNSPDEILSELLQRGADPNYLYPGGVKAKVVHPYLNSRSIYFDSKSDLTSALHVVFRSRMDLQAEDRYSGSWRIPGYHPFTEDSQLTSAPEDFIRIFKVLVAHGAKCDIHDGRGKSVAEFASELNSVELMEVMLSSLD